MIKTLIIENELASAENLATMIKNTFPDIEILEVCETAEKGINAINEYLPELVFMDIKLDEDKTAFDIIRNIGKVGFEIIFTTAYDKYAKQAFRVSALDFLEKPLDKNELIDAITKYKKKQVQGMNLRQLEILLTTYQNPSFPLKMFALPTTRGLTFIDIENIIYCEGASNQTMVHLDCKENKKECVNRTLKELEEILPSSIFSRIHKSYLINLNHVKNYTKGKDGQVVMSNGISLDVSRNFKDKFLGRFRSR